jgi:two-component system sensor histidine kinase ResE
MNKNLSLRRILILVLVSVSLYALVTMSVYAVLSPRIFAQAKLNELRPRAEYLAAQAAQYFSDNDPEAMQALRMNAQQWGATVFLLDETGAILDSNEPGDAGSYSGNVYNFDSLVQQVLRGENINRVSVLVQRSGGTARGADLLFIGIPVWVDGRVAGALLTLKPLEEIVASMSMLSSTLWIAALSVLSAILPLIYWFSRRIANPINHMRAVALRMAGGDFHARANDLERGEMGDLARALNHLSAELGNTIADLRRERNQAVAIVNTLHEGVIAISAGGRPTQTNPAMEALTRQAGGGKALPLPDEIWGDVRTALSENRPTDRRLDFGAIRLHVTVTPIADGRGGVPSAIAVLRDETEAYRLEQTRREYVANVSHELRTPLTALRAMIEPLRDGLIRTEAQKRDTYDIILRETMRLSRLVDDMLELSRLQSGTLALEKVRFPLAPLLHETAAIYAAKAANTGHSLSLELGDEKLPDVLGNPDRIEQVLVALLNNAFTYTPPGSHIALRTEAEAGLVRVIVEDNGPGIAPGDLPHVFDRFYKADKSHGGSSGTGLGLAIARELMDRLGETIAVENRDGGGARFWFTVGVG